MSLVVRKSKSRLIQSATTTTNATTNANASFALDCSCVSNLYESVYTKGDHERWLQIGSCGKSQRLPSERIFMRRLHELFLVNQSVLLFSCNSTQVTRVSRNKYDSVAHRLYRYTPISPLPSPPPSEKVKCHQNLCLRRFRPFS